MCASRGDWHFDEEIDNSKKIYYERVYPGAIELILKCVCGGGEFEITNDGVFTTYVRCVKCRTMKKFHKSMPPY